MSHRSEGLHAAGMGGMQSSVSGMDAVGNTYHVELIFAAVRLTVRLSLCPCVQWSSGHTWLGLCCHVLALTSLACCDLMLQCTTPQAEPEAARPVLSAVDWFLTMN